MLVVKHSNDPASLRFNFHSVVATVVGDFNDLVGPQVHLPFVRTRALLSQVIVSARYPDDSLYHHRYLRTPDAEKDSRGAVRRMVYWAKCLTGVNS